MNNMPWPPFMGPNFYDINNKIMELEKKIEEINNRVNILEKRLNNYNDYTDKNTGIYMI